MLFTMVMLGVVYLAFLAFLYYYAGISTLGMVIIAGGLLLLQYFYSDPPCALVHRSQERSPKAKPLSFMRWSLGSVP